MRKQRSWTSIKYCDILRREKYVAKAAIFLSKEEKCYQYEHKRTLYVCVKLTYHFVETQS